MSNLTKNAIKSSLMKLLNERPFNKITVKDIVEDCGINRNSFYYHFKDLPEVIEEIIANELHSILEQYPTIDSFEQCLSVGINFALKNKKAALHIYNSANREMFEQYLFEVCEHVVTVYIDKVIGTGVLDGKDRECIIQYYKCECVGQIIDWMKNGMKADIEEDFKRLYELRQGLAEQLIQRAAERKRNQDGI